MSSPVSLIINFQTKMIWYLAKNCSECGGHRGWVVMVSRYQWNLYGKYVWVNPPPRPILSPRPEWRWFTFHSPSPTIDWWVIITGTTIRAAFWQQFRYRRTPFRGGEGTTQKRNVDKKLRWTTQTRRDRGERGPSIKIHKSLIISEQQR